MQQWYFPNLYKNKLAGVPRTNLMLLRCEKIAEFPCRKTVGGDPPAVSVPSGLRAGNACPC
eukprot:673107-Pelagomonas_calceolata.AAC.11